MAGDVTFVLRWQGSDYFKRGDIASRKALMDIVKEAKSLARGIVYVKSGALQRSIHEAPRDYDPGSGDYRRARFGGEDLGVSMDMGDTAPTQGVLFGSWMPYAEIEEDERGRPFISPAVEMAGEKWEEYCRNRFRDEGAVDK